MEMKLGPVTKLDKEAKKRQKNLTIKSCREIVTSWLSFQFTANLERSLTQLSHYCFEVRYCSGQKMQIFLQKMMTSAKLRGPWS